MISSQSPCMSMTAGMSKLLIFSIFNFVLVQGSITSQSNATDYSQLEECPFPSNDQVKPCKCYGDSLYRIHLICELDSDVDERLLKKISQLFNCSPIYLLDFNLNGHQWVTDFSAEHFGNLVLNKLHIRNALSITGHLETDVFRSSAGSLTELVMEPSSKPGRGSIKQKSFSGLQKLTMVKLGW